MGNKKYAYHRPKRTVLPKVTAFSNELCEEDQCEANNPESSQKQVFRHIEFNSSKYDAHYKQTYQNV